MTMRFRQKPVLVTVVTATAALALLAGCSATGATPSKTSTGTSSAADGVSANKINVGLSTDLTGPSVANLTPYQQGVQTYFDQVNADGGINGRLINVDVQDDKTDATTGVAVYHKFVAQDPALVMLGTTTGIQAALAAEGTDTQLPLVGPLTIGKPFLSPTNPSWFSTACTYDDQFDVAAAYMTTKVAKVTKPKVFVVQAFNASGQEELSTLTTLINSAGGTIDGHYVLQNGALDYDVLAQQIAAAKPDWLFLHANIPSATVFMQSLKKFGVTNLNIGTTAVLRFASIPQTAPSTFKSWYAFDCYLKPSQAGAGGKAIIKAAKADGFNAAQYDLPAFSQGYVAAQVAGNAIKSAGVSPTRAKVIAALNKIKNFSTNGVSPDISFSSTDHTGIKTLQPFQFNKKTGDFDPVGKFADYAACLTHSYTTGSMSSWSPTCIK